MGSAGINQLARSGFLTGILLWIGVLSLSAQITYVDSVGLVIHRFEQQVQKLEVIPRKQGDIVFIGSSSIRGWKNLSEAFAPLPVINYGFGGSTLVEGLHFAPRLLYKYPPALLVIYLGENDLTLEYSSAEEVFQVFSAFADSLNRYLPTVPKLFVSVKPSLYSWNYWERQQEFNALAKAKIAEDSTLCWEYVDITRLMLGTDKKPLQELFLRDGLHMNSSGYARWTQAIKPAVSRWYAKTQSVR